ncbi:MAG: ACT domain-containing protein [Deltaproteobacteria bacterium]|nr:ACT domain-containing protein [Deltaproteobacteria bacterium]
MTTQLSVRLKDRPGELSKLSDLMGANGVNIRAFTASVHGDDSQFHMVVDEVEKAKDALRARGYDVHEHAVVVVEAPDHPGGLNAILKPLKEDGVNVSFLYPMIGRDQDDAVLILGPDDAERAARALRRNYIKILE